MRRHASVVYAIVVCLSVTSLCFTEMAKHRIMQTAPHNSPGTLVFCCLRSLQNSNGVTPDGDAEYRWGRLNWRLSTSNSL